MAIPKFPIRQYQQQPLQCQLPPSIFSFKPCSFPQRPFHAGQPPPGAAAAELFYAPPPVYASPTAEVADDPYAFLLNFDTVFLIDDSGSTAGRLWRETKAPLAVFAPFCTARDNDDVDVHFLNHRAAYRNSTSALGVGDFFAGVQLSGGAPTGIHLHEPLEPYLARKEQAHEQQQAAAYSKIEVMCKSVDYSQDTLIEYLKYSNQYRKAVEEEVTTDREVWSSVSKSCYEKAADSNVRIGHPDRHVGSLRAQSVHQSEQDPTALGLLTNLGRLRPLVYSAFSKLAASTGLLLNTRSMRYWFPFISTSALVRPVLAVQPIETSLQGRIHILEISLYILMAMSVSLGGRAAIQSGVERSVVTGALAGTWAGLWWVGMNQTSITTIEVITLFLFNVGFTAWYGVTRYGEQDMKHSHFWPIIPLTAMIDILWTSIGARQTQNSTQQDLVGFLFPAMTSSIWIWSRIFSILWPNNDRNSSSRADNLV